MAKKALQISLSECIRSVVNELCHDSMKKGEILVLTTFIDGQLITWTYPYYSNMEAAISIMNSSLIGIKTKLKVMKMQEEKRKAKAVRKQYTM